MLKQIGEIISPKGKRITYCKFIHFICYFNALTSIDQLQRLSIYPKNRQILHYICLYGHLHLLKDMMRTFPLNSLNLNVKDEDSTTPLVLAFKNKQLALISYLMRFPVLNLNEGSLKYGYPLHLGIKNHDFLIVREMLKPKHVVNVNAKDTDGNNAMHFLLSHFGYDSQNCSKIAIKLLKKGIEVNILNKQELSPLHVAIKSF